jgi:hypothetical protein
MSVITRGRFSFTIAEMLETVQKCRAEAEKVRRLGAAALDDLSPDELMGFDMEYTIAVMDYYHDTYVPSLSATKSA